MILFVIRNENTLVSQYSENEIPFQCNLSLKKCIKPILPKHQRFPIDDLCHSLNVNR
jgi:hypothetical protein